MRCPSWAARSAASACELIGSVIFSIADWSQAAFCQWTNRAFSTIIHRRLAGKRAWQVVLTRFQEVLPPVSRKARICQPGLEPLLWTNLEWRS